MGGVLFVAVSFFASGCGRLTFFRAEHLEATGSLPEAALLYRDFALSHPRDARAGEALWRSAELFGPKLGKCDLARPLLERLARDYGDPLAAQAKQGLLECPDFFPLKPGMKWVLVDPQTGGKNMRQEVSVQPVDPSGAVRLETKLYAGKKLFSTTVRSYKKEDWRVLETDAKQKTSGAILRYPFEPGTAWEESSKGRTMKYSIVSDTAVAKTRGGVFEGCLKVQEQVEGFPSWKADYYAPGVGRVLTTAGSAGGETPTAELLNVTKP